MFFNTLRYKYIIFRTNCVFKTWYFFQNSQYSLMLSTFYPITQMRSISCISWKSITEIVISFIILNHFSQERETLQPEMTSNEGTPTSLGSRIDLRVPQVPDKLLPHLIHTLLAFPNDTTNFSKPHVRTSLLKIYPLMVAAYVIVILLGTSLNIIMLWRSLSTSKILREKKRSFTDYLFIANIAVLNIVMSVLVIPLSLAIMLIQNWIFGQFFCYTAPLFQVRNQDTKVITKLVHCLYFLFNHELCYYHEIINFLS